MDLRIFNYQTFNDAILTDGAKDSQLIILSNHRTFHQFPINTNTSDGMAVTVENALELYFFRSNRWVIVVVLFVIVDNVVYQPKVKRLRNRLSEIVVSFLGNQT